MLSQKGYTQSDTKGESMIGIYVRCSTVGQNEAGQRREIQRWLGGHGISQSNVRWYVDKSSGDSLNRPGFGKLQRDVFRGEVRMVVVWKLDRLSRSLRDGINVLAGWCDRGIRIVSVTQQLDFAGAMGKMLAAVLLGVAEMEQETRRERPSSRHRRRERTRRLSRPEIWNDQGKPQACQRTACDGSDGQ